MPSFLDVTLQVEAVDRLHQAEARDLKQVVDGLPAAAVAQGELAGERHQPGHQLVTGREVAVLAVALQQAAILGGPLGRAGSSWGGAVHAMHSAAPSARINTGCPT
jgi:hypothetical protein